MRNIAGPLALVLVAALAAAAAAQSAPPTPGSWHAKPVIIVDPRAYLASPSPRPTTKRRATPRPRFPLRRPTPSAVTTPHTFERLDTAPTPAPTPRPRS